MAPPGVAILIFLLIACQWSNRSCSARGTLQSIQKQALQDARSFCGREFEVETSTVPFTTCGAFPMPRQKE